MMATIAAAGPMPSYRTAIRKWVRRLATVLLLPLAIGGAARILPPSPRMSLTLPDGQHVIGVSPDGNTLATWDGLNDEFFPQPGTIRLWDLRTGGPGPHLEDADELAGFAEFSPDSQVLCGIAGTNESVTCKTWSVARGELIGQLATERPGITSPHFAGDGRFVIFERYKEGQIRPGQIEFWDIRLQKARAAIPGDLQNSRWSADGRRLATYHYTDGGRIKRVAFYEPAAEELAIRLIGEHAVSAFGIAFGPDLGAFVTVDWPAGHEAEAALTLRDTITGAVLADRLPCEASWRVHRLELDRERRRLTVLWVDPHPDPFEARSCVTRTDYDLDSGRVTRRPWCWDVNGEFSPDYRWFAEERWGDPVSAELWDAARGEDRGPLCHPPGERWLESYGHFHFTKDSRFLLVCGLSDGTTGELSVSFHADRRGPIQVTRKGGAVARLWHLEAQREVCAYDGCVKASLSKDDQTIVAIGSTGKEVSVWDVPARKPWGMSVAAGSGAWVLSLAAWWAVRRTGRRPGRSHPA
jgi:WD40 repeat protein